MDPADEVVARLALLGGVATSAQLAGVPRRAVARAVREGRIRRDGVGVFSLPDAEASLREARRLGGARSHLTAALAHGWSVAGSPARPQIVVPQGRPVAVSDRRRADVRHRPLSRSERDRALTEPLATVMDCARDLDLLDSLPVADAALRSGLVGAQELSRAASRAVGRGSARARRVADHADGRAANAFESRLRALSLDVRRLRLTPQVSIMADGLLRVVDLADVELGIIAEADSYTWHGGRADLLGDCERYDALVLEGWLVLRFGFEHVFAEPGWVRTSLGRACELRRRRLSSATWRSTLIASDSEGTWPAA